jgi:PEP-CTERM motif
MDVDFSALIYLQLTDPGNIPLHFGYPPAVPEPESWAMALLGLAVLGVNARRRAN